jgi:two-component system, LytTR family, response regulator LytT
MKVIIIEDESLAADRLKLLLSQYDEQIQVAAVLDSVEESIKYLQTRATPDLIFCDIHLSDGHSFEIFEHVAIKTPIVFTTAYDNYAITAFKTNGIDYILKPVTAEALATAINKYKQMQWSATASIKQLEAPISKNNFKERFVGKIGQRLFFIDINQISCFISENKMVYILDDKGMKYHINNTLDELEEILAPELFFRLNRKTIVNINAIQQAKPFFNQRLKLDLQAKLEEEYCIVSREKVTLFKVWAGA